MYLDLISLQKINQVDYIWNKLEEQTIMASIIENLSDAPAQFIPALAYIVGQVEQEAKSCERQRSMSRLINFFLSSPPFQVEIYDYKYQTIGK